MEILDGRIVEDIDFALPRGAVITGRVVDELGYSAEEARVAILCPQNIDGPRRLVPVGNAVTTDDLGEFRLFGISPGHTMCRPPRAIGLPARRPTPASRRPTRRCTFPAPPTPPRRNA